MADENQTVNVAKMLYMAVIVDCVSCL